MVTGPEITSKSFFIYMFGAWAKKIQVAGTPQDSMTIWYLYTVSKWQLCHRQTFYVISLDSKGTGAERQRQRRARLKLDHFFLPGFERCLSTRAGSNTTQMTPYEDTSHQIRAILNPVWPH
jgi:hypothetical protein